VNRSFEGMAQVVIMLVIGAAAGAGSFTHVHDVAAAHGQDGWLAWADAVVLELMSIASGLELRRRKRAHVSVAFPATVMAAAVVLSLGAQVVEAERSALGWIAAAIPALGFLVMVKIALSHAAGPPPSVSASDARVPDQDGSRGSRDGAPAGVGTAAANEVDPKPAAPPNLTLVDEADPVVQSLIPAARSAAVSLEAQGRRMSRNALADVLRAGDTPSRTPEPPPC
jgi:hypothetical protein